jgi:4-hydroxybenzoate polyprenyltransferase
MRFLPWVIILLLLGYSFWGMQRTPQRTSSTREKALAIRGIAMLIVLGIVFIAALLFLPNKARVLMMLPAFFVVVGVGKAWRNSRERLRREEQQRVDLEKMKRVN